MNKQTQEMQNAPGLGHNNPPSEVSSERLKSFVARIEKLEADKAVVVEDIRDIYAEAKGTGFDVKTLRTIMRERKIDEQKRREQAELLDLYKCAIGMEV